MQRPAWFLNTSATSTCLYPHRPEHIQRAEAVGRLDIAEAEKGVSTQLAMLGQLAFPSMLGLALGA